MTSELDKLRKMLNKMHTGMMVTRRPDGHLVSRAMAQQKDAPGADLWFVTSVGTAKVDEIEHDPHVNLTFFDSSKREWISIAGLAKLSRDKETIRQLYASDWKMYFPDEGDPRHGTADDPRLVLVGVDIHTAVFFELDKPQPVVLFELVKGWLTGSEPDIGEMHELKMNP